MRHIFPPKESDEPSQFTYWKERHPNAKYYRFKDSRLKRILKESLIARQKKLCCYCESRISAENSHIEHIEPQMGGLSEKSMLFSNMAASCIRDPKKHDDSFEPTTFAELVESDLHCGHARGTNAVISPYDPKCENLFKYSFSGEISVADGLSKADAEIAESSIHYLRLNVPALVLLRKIAMFEKL